MIPSCSHTSRVYSLATTRETPGSPSTISPVLVWVPSRRVYASTSQTSPRLRPLSLLLCQRQIQIPSRTPPGQAILHHTREARAATRTLEVEAGAGADRILLVVDRGRGRGPEATALRADLVPGVCLIAGLEVAQFLLLRMQRAGGLPQREVAKERRPKVVGAGKGQGVSQHQADRIPVLPGRFRGLRHDSVRRRGVLRRIWKSHPYTQAEGYPHQRQNPSKEGTRHTHDREVDLRILVSPRRAGMVRHPALAQVGEGWEAAAGEDHHQRVNPMQSLWVPVEAGHVLQTIYD